MLFIIQMSKKRIHNPSRYREIVRNAKSGDRKDLTILIDEARDLNDPYYSSLALFDLSSDPRLNLVLATTVAEEAISGCNKVDRLWRRAELFTLIAKKISSWRNHETTQIKIKLLNKITDSIILMPIGKGLSDAIVGCAPYLCHKCLGTLLSKAITNKGFETIDAKVVIRQWANRCKEEGPKLEEIMSILENINDKIIRSKLLGYLHLQLKKSKWSQNFSPLNYAVETAISVKKEERIDILRYLAKLSSSKEEFDIVSKSLKSLEDNEERARLLATLGGYADKVGQKELAIDYFKTGLENISKIESVDSRANIILNFAQGIWRCGELELAEQTFNQALNDCCENDRLRNRICISMENLGFKIPEGDKIEYQDSERSLKSSETIIEDKIRHILALYDTYEGGIKPIHLRAVARAAPLCTAFDLDLALMGFPTNDLESLIDQVITETNIGKGGKYLKDLLKEKRIKLVSSDKHQVLEDWNNLGLPVATTSHPSREKKIEIDVAVQIARLEHPLQRLCLIMGLGKKGLPNSLIESVRHQLELTDKYIPLETCTAMGVIAQKLKSIENVK